MRSHPDKTSISECLLNFPNPGSTTRQEAHNLRPGSYEGMAYWDFLEDHLGGGSIPAFISNCEEVKGVTGPRVLGMGAAPF